MVRESEKQGATTRHPSEWKREKKPENGAMWRSEPSAAKSHCTKPARACGAHSGNGECALSALSAFSPLAFHEVARRDVFRRKKNVFRRKNTPPTHPPQQPVRKPRNRPTFTPVCLRRGEQRVTTRPIVPISSEGWSTAHRTDYTIPRDR